MVDKQLFVLLYWHLSCAASGASDAPPGSGSAMSFHDWADDHVVDGGCVDPFRPDDGGYDAYSLISSSSGEIVVDVAPRVTADLDTPEGEEQLRNFSRWQIQKRHGECANCHRARGSPGSRATGGDGRCRWCGGYVCSQDCFREHDVKCEERPPSDGGGNPEEVHKELDPSHSRETPSTPIFRKAESVEIVAMLQRWVQRCYEENAARDGYFLLLSRCHLAGMLHACAEQVSLGQVGRLSAESFQPMPDEDRRPPTPLPAEWPPPSGNGGYGSWV